MNKTIIMIVAMLIACVGISNAMTDCIQYADGTIECDSNGQCDWDYTANIPYGCHFFDMCFEQMVGTGLTCDSQSGQTNNYYSGGGGGFGQSDMEEYLYGPFQEWLFDTYATKDEMEELYEYVEILHTNGDTTQALMLKAIRLGHTVTKDGVTCDPHFGCVAIG